MKELYLVFKVKGVEKVAYTLKDTFPGEKQDTLELIAYENECKIEEIEVSIEERWKNEKL